MQNTGACEECGVPEMFYRGTTWLNNGDIVQRANQQVRVGFVECEPLDPLFKYVGDIIGTPIENLVINIAYRGFKLYLDQIIPEDVQKLLHDQAIDRQPFIDTMTGLCEINGFGKYEIGDNRQQNDEDDYAKLRVLKPFSLPEVAGAFAGAVSIIAGGEHSISYEEVSPNLYEFTSRWARYAKVLKEKMQVGAGYHHSDGDIELERCGSCGGPKALAGYLWNQDEGLIMNRDTGMRMALLGPELLDRLFEAIESELGEAIPEVIVEAKRRLIRSRIFSSAKFRGEEELRNELALKGAGNLQEIKVSPRGVQMRIQNASGYHLTVGFIQGTFELMFDKESAVKWELSKNRDLQLEVIPLFKHFTPGA